MFAGRSFLLLSAALCVGLTFSVGATASASAALIFGPTQQQLFNADDVTVAFGGNGEVLSRSLQGEGVLYELQSGTTDFGKVSLEILDPSDLSTFEAYGLSIEFLSASEAVEINPFVRTGPTGLNFFEKKPGVKEEGDLFVTLMPLSGLAEIDTVYSYGFQVFTAGDVISPVSQRVTIRVTAIPEPSPIIAVVAGVAVFVLMRRRRVDTSNSTRSS